MPKSQQPAEGEQMILDRILSKSNHIIMDVGVGSNAKWGRLLKGKVLRIDGIEIWGPNVAEYSLWKYYDRFYIVDAARWPYWKYYETVVLGDVLEHLPRRKAETLVKHIKYSGANIFLTIPISECIQDGTVYDNPYETHLEQWTHEQVIALGFTQLHEGLNPNGLVTIGTYTLYAD